MDIAAVIIAGLAFIFTVLGILFKEYYSKAVIEEEIKGLRTKHDETERSLTAVKSCNIDLKIKMALLEEQYMEIKERFGKLELSIDTRLSEIQREQKDQREHVIKILTILEQEEKK